MLSRESLAVVVSIIGAIGLIVGGFLVGHGFYRARAADRYVTVKGLAEKDVSADLAFWTINFSATGNDLTSVQREIQGASNAVVAFLKKRGLGDDEIAVGKLNVTDMEAQTYRPQGPVTSRYIINANVSIRSNKVSEVARIARETGALVEAGVVLGDSWGPTYAFTKLSEVKPPMIAEATKNARAAAEQFAKDSGSSVGGIRRANQGVFQILPRDGGNQGEATQINKKVRVVSTIDYFLE